MTLMLSRTYTHIPLHARASMSEPFCQVGLADRPPEPVQPRSPVVTCSRPLVVSHRLQHFMQTIAAFQQMAERMTRGTAAIQRWATELRSTIERLKAPGTIVAAPVQPSLLPAFATVGRPKAVRHPWAKRVWLQATAIGKRRVRVIVEAVLTLLVVEALQTLVLEAWDIIIRLLEDE